MQPITLKQAFENINSGIDVIIIDKLSGMVETYSASIDHINYIVDAGERLEYRFYISI